VGAVAGTGAPSSFGRRRRRIQSWRPHSWLAFGRTRGEQVKDRPVYPNDLLASIYELTGDRSGRHGAPSSGD